MKKVLLINAHHKYDGISNGQLNDTLINVIADEVHRVNGELVVTNIEQFYDIDEEVEKHMWADIIITQSPVYWCALPWQYKKYIEEVFNAGLAAQKFVVNDGRTTQDPSRQYGTGGLMQGKKFMLSLTWNAPKQVFSNPKHAMFKGRSVDDLFANLMSVYEFCGVEALPSFSCLDVIKAPDIENDIKSLQNQLIKVLV